MRRRDFLSLAAAPALGAQPGDKYRTALVGSGWWGMNILTCAMEAGQSTVVALCDVDQNQLKPAVERVVKLSGDQPATYTDYRELLAKEKPEIVIVATPDHWHPLAMIAAVEAGAHVYVEKPISHTILEGRAMVKAARAANRVVQVGLHRRVSLLRHCCHGKGVGGPGLAPGYGVFAGRGKARLHHAARAQLEAAGP